MHVLRGVCAHHPQTCLSELRRRAREASATSGGQTRHLSGIDRTHLQAAGLWQRHLTMKRVTGIGGIFFKAKDAPALQAWYKRHLGIDVQEWGGTAFTWTDGEGNPVAGTTIWSVGSAEGDHFAPSTASFMV